MNKEISVQKYKSLKEDSKLRKQAQHMYLHKGFYPTEIADTLGIDINELGHYVFGSDRTGTAKTSWKYMLDNDVMPNHVGYYKEVKNSYIKKTESKLLDAVNKVADHILDDEDAIQDMTTKDLSNLVTSFSQIDKIGRLEDGKSTSNVTTRRTSYSLREIVSGKDKETREVSPEDYDVEDITPEDN
jgi:hypothetical protein